MKDIVLPYDAVQSSIDGTGGGKYATRRISVEPIPLDPAAVAVDANDENSNFPVRDRSPIIAVMGHIDHGKTTLLDTLRGSSIAATEIEGITQTINVCEAVIDGGGGGGGGAGGRQRVVATFLDTPGHYHFYRMRNSAANLADAALLLVSLEDGIMDQTEEAIGCIEGENIPAIVCLNKMDLASADKIKVLTKELRKYVALENAPMIAISALDKSTLDPVLESLRNVVRSDKVSLKSIFDPAVNADGVALELVKRRNAGSVIRLLIRNGIVRPGSHFVCGLIQGKIRKLTNVSTGAEVDEGFPGCVVDVTYSSRLKKLEHVPLELEFYVVSERDAKVIFDQRKMAIHFEMCKQKKLPSQDVMSDATKQVRVLKKKKKNVLNP
eukprot:CAMPEP_0172503810 /NCGR_PEP_ID=MMETSP1066-20121228/172480_1 /TAXON_ID=671091 /ORGANISM="Coscinodiscus wailesii, Strain CCMP2513" /LENGTH=381 /DNA_ID=CAMNT_0013279701 /DNA_START=354 /DNA_END=1500 /DNA_ORIENTATION=+